MPKHIQNHFTRPRRGLKYKFAHPLDILLTALNTATRTRLSLRNFYAFFSFISHMEPKYYVEALADPNWILVMQDEFNQFERNQVWSFTRRLDDRPLIGTIQVFRNKLDEPKVVRNKAKLVAEVYNREEGIDFDETFASVARLEVTRIFLAFGSHMGIKLFQMNVKCAFLNGFLNKEVYVEQSLRFGSHKFLNHVFKPHKALYG